MNDTILFSQVAHLYMGCRVKLVEPLDDDCDVNIDVDNLTLCMLNYGDMSIGVGSDFYPWEVGLKDGRGSVVGTYLGKSYFIPLLKSLSDLTVEEFQEMGLFDASDKGWNLSQQRDFTVSKWIALLSSYTPAQFTYLLGKGYDLFSLIESGGAIDIKSM